MILYSLRCANTHHFDAWFRNSDAYDAQAQAGLLECPVCATSDVGKALMAPRIHSGREVGPTLEADVEPAENGAGQDRGDGGPRRSSQGEPTRPDSGGRTDHGLTRAMVAHALVMTAARQLRRHVERTHQHVGTEFVDEVRRMHRGEVEHRLVYGDATPEEAEDLKDEGIDVSPIPWVPLEDA